MMATVTMLLIGGLLLVPAGSREQCPTSYVVQPRLDGVTGPWGLFLTSIPRSLPCLTCARLPGLEDEQRQKIAVLLSLRGGGARNKWRRKQNRNRVAGKDSGAARPGVAAAQEAHGPSFQAHWQNFKRGAGRWQGFQPGSRDRGTRRQARADVSEEASFISSREVDSDGNEVVYVDSQGNEVPASQVDDGDSGMSLGDSESEYVYVDQYGNPLGGGGGFRSRPPGPVNNTAFYALLGVERNCTEDEVKKAYKRMALKWHPDKNPENKTFAESMFKKVSDAYQVLSDPQKRTVYDKHGEKALSGQEGVAEESDDGGTAGFGDFRSAEDLFRTFFGGGASVFEVGGEDGGGGGSNIFSFVVGGDEDDDDDDDDADEEEWEEVDLSEGRHRSGSRSGHARGRGAQRGRSAWRGGRGGQSHRGGWRGGGIDAGSGFRRGRGGQRGGRGRGGRSGSGWGWGRRGGKRVPDDIGALPRGVQAGRVDT